MILNSINHKKFGKPIIYTFVTLILMSAIVLSLIGYLYNTAEERAYENLHVQTKQIKDDLTLQILSDRENLATMANFAAKLYLDGDDYSLMFNSFKPIGLIENIGILTPDNTFITKSGSISLDGRISFEDEVTRGAYISGRIADLTNDGYELIRSAVPIVAGGETVGVLYGVIKLDKISEKYTVMANELNAQLFIYDAQEGNLIVDTVHDELGNISFLKERKYNKGYSYEEIENSVNGFSSFESAYRDEDVLMHYSAIDDLDWKIALVRYDSQVFLEVHSLMKVLFIVLASMIIVMSVFSSLIMVAERRKAAVTDCAANIRRTLLEASGTKKHIAEALKDVCLFTESRSAIFFDTNGEDYRYISTKHHELMMPDSKRKVLMSEILRYVSEYLVQGESAINVMHLEAKKLSETNPYFCQLMREYGIEELVFSATVNNSNHITVLCVMNPKRKAAAKLLCEKVSACFSIALINQTILNKTRLAATTDSLTGVMNRVAYNNDLHDINEEKPMDFSCIYVDVNELHYRNNKFGHAAGDEMLLFIAHSLKDVFFGQKVYRMGGDEFLVFCQNSSQDEVKKGIEIFLEQLKPRDYHVAIGLSYRSQNTNTEEMVREAEVRMYEEKAKYYQNKSRSHDITTAESNYVVAKTGIREIDTMLSVLKENYNGIYRVSLDTDKATRVLMPAYLKYNETEEDFSKLFAKYVSESAESDYHRALLSFRNYDALKQQISAGKTPEITYKKLNGETVTLSVHKLCDTDETVFDTLWIFAKK